MKIAIIGTVASSILSFRRDLIKTLLLNGHDVYALATDYNEVSRQDVINLGAVPTEYNFNRTGINPAQDLLDTIKLSNTLKKIKPDLVFSYFAKPVIFGTIAARLAGVKRRVAMLEGLGFIFTDQPAGRSIKNRVLRAVQVHLYKITFPLLEQIIFLNPDDPKDLVNSYKIKIKKVTVLGGIGLDLSEYPYVKPNINEVSFLFIGRLLKEKGIDDFIEAARLVRQQYPNIKFTVLGGLDEGNPGGLKATTLSKLINIGLIEYPGHVNNISEYIAKHSVFVLPSYYREGVPRSTQEAMAVGRPVITTDLPGCRETVLDGRNGFLIPPWRPDVLAKKMIYFIEKPDQIEKMGLESYYMAQQKFDAIKVNSRLMEMLNLC